MRESNQWKVAPRRNSPAPHMVSGGLINEITHQRSIQTGDHLHPFYPFRFLGAVSKAASSVDRFSKICAVYNNFHNTFLRKIVLECFSERLYIAIRPMTNGRSRSASDVALVI